MKLPALILGSLLVLPLVLAQDPPSMSPVPAKNEAAPASAPAPGESARRPRPRQSEVLEDLLREREREGRIRPRHSQLGAGSGTAQAAGKPAPGEPLPDGKMVVDRAGRLIRAESKSQFRFAAEDVELGNRTLEFLKNSWLERMERDAELGATEFFITAEVTRYRGENFLLLQKYRRQVTNGNLAP